jgi:hypothetical protein
VKKFLEDVNKKASPSAGLISKSFEYLGSDLPLMGFICAFLAEQIRDSLNFPRAEGLGDRRF